MLFSPTDTRTMVKCVLLFREGGKLQDLCESVVFNCLFPENLMSKYSLAGGKKEECQYSVAN